MLDAFGALGLGDKIAVVGMHLLGVALVVLYALLIEEKKKVKALSRRIALLAKQGIEDTKSATSRNYKSENMQKPIKKAIVWKHLLSIIANFLKKRAFYYSTDNKGNNQKQKGNQSHSKRIIERLKKGVNRNRAEPSETYCNAWIREENVGKQ